MIVELAHFALTLALATSLLGTFVPFWGARTGDNAMMRVGVPATIVVFVLIAFSFAVLTAAYLLSDFSLANVAANSHTTKPLIYKISGVWGNHEGSMLLWVLILAFFSFLVSLFGGALPLRLKAQVLASQSFIGACFLLFILLTSNPFERLDPPNIEGQGLNPILQDPGLAIHPPLLYLGYVGLSVTFSFAIAALLEGRIDRVWARWVRPWALGAWVFLTLGIVMGSYWAYYELGWGGWWFWDPVENSSFMPWLIATALLHSAVVMEKRGCLKVWTVLLALIGFSFSLLGTFLVRSGVLTSVHAFANDPERGQFILALLVLFVFGSLMLFAWRAPVLRQGRLFAPISREAALIVNNLFLVTSTVVVLVGTLWPLALEALRGEKISVGAQFFNLTFVPLLLPLLVLLPLAPLLAWKKGDIYAAGQRLWVAACCGFAGLLVFAFFSGVSGVLAPLAAGIGFWVICGALSELFSRAAFRKVGLALGFRRLFGLPKAAWGMALAHIGVGVSVLGMVAVTTMEVEKVALARPGVPLEAAGFSVVLEGINEQQGANYRDTVATFSVFKGETRLATLTPAKRAYQQARAMTTTESSIYTRGFSQLYLALGDVQDNGRSVQVRFYYKPFVLLIWLGGVLMAMGGGLSLLDRRLRIGAVKAKTLAPAATPATTA